MAESVRDEEFRKQASELLAGSVRSLLESFGQFDPPPERLLSVMLERYSPAAVAAALDKLGLSVEWELRQHKRIVESGVVAPEVKQKSLDEIARLRAVALGRMLAEKVHRRGPGRPRKQEAVTQQQEQGAEHREHVRRHGREFFKRLEQVDGG